MIRSQRKHARRSGQALIEYSLILVLITCVVLVVVITMGNQLLLTYQDIQAQVTYLGGANGDTVFTCPDSTAAVLHGHRYWCHP
jgi:Flp pilus assembly pilin Flp